MLRMYKTNVERYDRKSIIERSTHFSPVIEKDENEPGDFIFRIVQRLCKKTEKLLIKNY